MFFIKNKKGGRGCFPLKEEKDMSKKDEDRIEEDRKREFRRFLNDPESNRCFEVSLDLSDACPDCVSDLAVAGANGPLCSQHESARLARVLYHRHYQR